MITEKKNQKRRSKTPNIRWKTHEHHYQPDLPNQVLTRWAAELDCHLKGSVWLKQPDLLIIQGLCIALFHFYSKFCSTSSKIKTPSYQRPEGIISSSWSYCCFTWHEAQHNLCSFTNLTCSFDFPHSALGSPKATHPTLLHMHIGPDLIFLWVIWCLHRVVK